MLKYVAAEFQYEACAEFVSRRRQCCECRPRLFLPAVPRLATFVQATAIESYCTGVLMWVGVRGCLHGFSPVLYTVLTRVLTGTYTGAVRCPALAGSISSGNLFFCLQGHRVPVYSPSGRGSEVSEDPGDIHRALAS